MRKWLIIAFVGFASMPSVYAMGRSVSHLSDSEQWAKASRTLLNGRYVYRGEVTDFEGADLGYIQAGPFVREGGGGDPTIVLTTYQAGLCRLLSKPLQQLNDEMAPTRVEEVDCAKGLELRREARLPDSVPGFTALSEQGRSILMQINNVPWSLGRQCQIQDSLKIVPFQQDLVLNFGDARSYIEMESQARAFTFIHLTKSYRSYVAQTTIGRILEQKLATGAHRFLIWSTAPDWQLKAASPRDPDDNFKMSMAVVNPWMMGQGTSSQPILLKPNQEICVDGSCRDLRFQPFTQVLSFHFMVIEVNPKQPENLRIELHQVSRDLPSVTLSMSRRGG